MRKSIIATALSVAAALVVTAAPASAWQVPQVPQGLQTRCRVSDLGGGPAGSDVTVSASNTDSLFDARLIVVRQRRAPVGVIPSTKHTKTLLSVEIPEGTSTFTFRIHKGFRNGALVWAFVQDGDPRLNGCETVDVDVANLFVPGVD